jgi:outer membrane protein, protease secretion system
MKSGVTLLLCVIGQCGAWAGGFQQSYEAALQTDPTFQAARAELASVQQNMPMARAGLLPNLALSLSDAQVKGSRSRDLPNGGSISDPLDYRAPFSSLTLRAPLYNREASQKLEVARAQVSYANAVFVARNADLVDRLANAYFQRLLAEQAVLAARSQLDAAQAQHESARRRLQLGEGARPELVEAEAALDMARSLLVEAQNQVSVTRLSLRQITGIDQESLATVEGGFTSQAQLMRLPATTQSLPELLEKAYADSPAIVARRFAIAQAQATVARNSAGHYPRLDLVASASAGMNESIATLNQSSNQRSLGLQLNVPIYSGGYTDASVTQALADQGKAEAELAAEQNLVARELTKLYLAVTNGPAKIQAFQKAVASGTLALEGMRRGLSTGFNTQADVVLAQRKLAQARSDLDEAIYDYLLTRVRLLVRTGAEPAQVVVHLDQLLSSPLRGAP